MKKKVIAILSVLSILSSSFVLGERVRFIYIDTELQHAKSIQLVKVYGYTQTSLLYGKMGLKDTFSINSKFGKDARLQATNKITRNENPKDEWAGKWPAIGQQVLIVSDSLNKLKLFAFRIENDYRFWDPYSGPFANSVFWFPSKYPYKQLPYCFGINSDKTESLSCSDGCLVDAGFIKERK